MQTFTSIKSAYSSRRLLWDILAGLAATTAMSVFQNAWNTAAELSGTRDWNAPPEPTDIEGTTELVAAAADILHLDISAAQRKKAGICCHYAFGVGMGVTYGFIRSAAPASVRRWNVALTGAAFGSLIFFVGNEVILPRIGVSTGGSRSPLGSRPYGLASHVVYGLALAAAHNLTK